MSLSAAEKKTLRQIAHHLDVVVTVGDQGVTDGVVAETERALADHELIKVKLAAGDRGARQAVGNKLVLTCTAELVQTIGKVIVLYRANPKPNPRLSNVARYR